MIKLIVLDVDGTLTDKARKISLNAIENIRKVISNDILVSLVSGNVIPVMFGLKTYIGINGPVFGENGGIMLNNSEITHFFSKNLPKQFLNEISRTTSAREMFTNQWRETSVAFTMDEEDREAVSKKAVEKGLYIVDSKFAWHIMNRGQNKAFAVEYLKKLYDIDNSNILVIGDSDNDLSMFELNVHRASPSNASSSIRNLSEYVSEYPYGNEIGDIFEHYHLL